MSSPRPSSAASLAVWDIPAPAVVGEQFAVKVGAKSPAGDDLRGHRVEVRDAGGGVIGEGRLGETPWAGTEALYWAEVSLPAPADEGIATLSARCHGAEAQFSIAVARAADHTLTVKVVAKETAAPIADAELRLGVYRATTDRDGLATLRVCKGSDIRHPRSRWRSRTTRISRSKR
jgi:hypothetical protein